MQFDQDKPEVGVINANKETFHLLMRIRTVLSYFVLPNGCQVLKCFDDLDHIWSLYGHFHTNAHDREASND